MHRLRYPVTSVSQTVRSGQCKKFALSQDEPEAENTPYSKSSLQQV